MLKVTTSSTNTLYVIQIEYNFRWLQHPLQNLKKTDLEKDNTYKPLSALNVGTSLKIYSNCVNCEWPRSENVSPLQAMVNFNRISLLTHPVCKKYLEMKWWVIQLKPESAISDVSASWAKERSVLQECLWDQSTSAQYDCVCTGGVSSNISHCESEAHTGHCKKCHISQHGLHVPVQGTIC